MPDPNVAQIIENGGGGSTKYYEIAGIALSLIQAILYLWLFTEYVDKLEKLADQLTKWAEGDGDEQGDIEKLKEVHHWDDEFHKWYDRFFQTGHYQECDVDILRSKGGPFRQFGRQMRIERFTNSGYTPLALLRHVEYHAAQITSVSAVNRATAHVAEEDRKWKDYLNRWDVNVSRPINRENEGVNFDPIIKQYTESMNMFGKGFNSAGIAFGNALYQYLRK